MDTVVIEMGQMAPNLLKKVQKGDDFIEVEQEGSVVNRHNLDELSFTVFARGL